MLIQVDSRLKLVIQVARLQKDHLYLKTLCNLIALGQKKILGVFSSKVQLIGKKCTTIDFRFKQRKWYFLESKNYCTTYYFSPFLKISSFIGWLSKERLTRDFKNRVRPFLAILLFTHVLQLKLISQELNPFCHFCVVFQGVFERFYITLDKISSNIEFVQDIY